MAFPLLEKPEPVTVWHTEKQVLSGGSTDSLVFKVKFVQLMEVESKTEAQ